MEQIGTYALRTRTLLSFDEALEKATSSLKDEGFGVLTEIDVRQTLKEKLNIEFKPFRILGACNPPLAHQALEAVPEVSVFLPCNVVVWDEGDHRIVAAMEPLIMAEIVSHPKIAELAKDVSSRLHRVIGRFDKA